MLKNLHLLPLVITITFLSLTCSRKVLAHVDHDAAGGLKLMSDALEWPVSMSMYSDIDESSDLEDGFLGFDVDDDEGSDEMSRRSLFWRRVQYYISYGALSANRIPCPPRSGRSYYTRDCYKSRTPVNPYHRGCSRIARCRS